METYALSRPPVNGATSDEQRRDLVLSWLRCIDARALTFTNELRYIGVALKGGLVSPDGALEWLNELDPVFLSLVGADR